MPHANSMHYMGAATVINIAKSEQSSHTPGGSHQRPLKLESKMDKGTDKQYVAEFFIHSTTSQI